MNQRIKELAKQADKWSDEEFHRLFLANETPDRQKLFKTKFAELIIDEVLQVIAVSDSKCYNEWDFAERDIYVEIQKHFGVEE